MPELPPLRRLHSDETLNRSFHRISLEYWRRKPTRTIVESLKPRHRDPGYQEFLKVKPDGTIMQGNTRIKILEERGYNINQLPRTIFDG
ncbi:MAG TPA: hypothetical protein VHX86_08485 [Tepidisphaeraceae bacterium]|jgi:hypothetical protein|nr:hypothetical protein [Tepidisphaeraceae bacterium]